MVDAPNLADASASALHSRAAPGPTSQHLQILSDVFGLPGFRGGQYEACCATLSGRDSLVILPTGAGKSLTFQFPPHAMPSGFTVVVGPLLALMKDQVEKCLERDLDACVFNSDCSEVQKRRILSDLVSQEPSVRLVYTTPESLRQPRLREALKEASQQGTLVSFAIDEAHCISDWGHDFRPSYLELKSLKQDFPNTPIAALSATCTPQVQKTIISLLNLRDPVIVKASFNRPNIQYIVRYKDLLGDGVGRPVGSDQDCLDDLVSFLRSREGQGGIIYARTRAACDWLAQSLGSLDLEVGCYHAGKDAATRARVQREWSDGSIHVVVATIAFGMGIDRADVRWVVHWNVPACIEGFMQESGRAGRDGLHSTSVLYVGRSDLQNASRMESGGKAGGVQAVKELCMEARCRRQRLLKHFGETRGPCGSAPGELACDVCSGGSAVRRCLNALEHSEESAAMAAVLRARMNGMRACASQEEHPGSDGGDAEAGGDTGNQQQAGPTGARGHVGYRQQVLAAKGGWWNSARALPDSGSTVAATGAGGSVQQQPPAGHTTSASHAMGASQQHTSGPAPFQASWVGMGPPVVAQAPTHTIAEVTPPKQLQRPAVPRLHKRKAEAMSGGATAPGDGAAKQFVLPRARSPQQPVCRSRHFPVADAPQPAAFTQPSASTATTWESSAATAEPGVASAPWPQPLQPMLPQPAATWPTKPTHITQPIATTQPLHPTTQLPRTTQSPQHNPPAHAAHPVSGTRTSGASRASVLPWLQPSSAHKHTNNRSGPATSNTVSDMACDLFLGHSSTTAGHSAPAYAHHSSGGAPSALGNTGSMYQHTSGQAVAAPMQAGSCVTGVIGPGSGAGGGAQVTQGPAGGQGEHKPVCGVPQRNVANKTSGRQPFRPPRTRQ